MNANKNMKLPADCTLMTEEEMMTANGGSAAETAVKAVIAVGGAAALLVVGSIAARGILSIFGGVDSAMKIRWTPARASSAAHWTPARVFSAP